MAGVVTTVGVALDRNYQRPDWRPVAAKWWAWIGAGWMAAMVYMWTRWALSDHHYTDPGPDKQPG